MAQKIWEGGLGEGGFPETAWKETLLSALPKCLQTAEVSTATLSGRDGVVLLLFFANKKQVCIPFGETGHFFKTTWKQFQTASLLLTVFCRGKQTFAEAVCFREERNN